MPDVTQNVLVDFQLNNQQLSATIDLLQKNQDLSQASVETYKQVNSAIQQNTALVNQNTEATDANNATASEQQQIYDTLTKSLSTLSGASKKAVTDLLQLNPADITKGFQQLGLSVDQYVSILQTASSQQTKTQTSGVSLRQELRNITQQMAQLQLAGQGASQEFADLAEKVGPLKLALRDTQQVVTGLGSEAPTLQLFSAGVRGIGAAFQGSVAASALFGDQNKDLQETLIKVNGVMALTQSINEAVNIIRDRSLITLAQQIVLEKIESAQLAINNGLESESIIVRTAAIIAQKALNLAMEANPILLLIAGLITFVVAAYNYTQSTKAMTEATAELNNEIENSAKLLDAQLSGIKDSGDQQLALAQSLNQKQSEINAIAGNNLILQQQTVRDQIVKLATDLNQKRLLVQQTGDKDLAAAVIKGEATLLDLQTKDAALQTEIYKKKVDQQKQITVEGLQSQIDAASAANDLVAQNSTKQFATARTLANAQAALEIQNAGDNAAKVAEIQAALSKKIRDINQQENQFVAADKLASAEDTATKLTAQSQAINDRQTQQEVDANAVVLQKQLAQTLANNKLTADERLAAIDKTNAQIAANQRAFDKQSIADANQDDIARNQMILQNQQLSLQQQLQAKITELEDEAAVEVANNKGKSDVIAGIYAKLNNDILTARKAAIDQQAKFELDAFQTTVADEDRLLTKSLADQAAIRNAQGGLGADTRVAAQLGAQKQSTAQQLNDIDVITDHQNSAIQIQIDALNKKRDVAGSLSKDETNQLDSLIDQQVKATEDGEKKKQDLINETADLQQKRNREIVQDSLQGVSDGLSVLASFYQQQDAAANAAIAAQKQHVTDALNAGTITAKAAAVQQTQLDAQAKKLQREQAQRNKEIAIFQAIINTALAVTNAITTGDPYTAVLRAAIAGALGAAQIAVIASQPLPQFFKGKKDQWEGIGLIGERGSELVEKDGSMYLVNKPTPMYLAAEDKVYTPRETESMMENMTFGKNLIAGPRNGQSVSQPIDYDRFGKSVASNIPQYGMELTEDGLREWMKKGNLTEKYLNKRKGWIRK